MTTIKFTEDQILLNKLKASYFKDKDDEKTNFDFFDAPAINSDLEIPNSQHPRKRQGEPSKESLPVFEGLTSTTFQFFIV